MMHRSSVIRGHLYITSGYFEAFLNHPPTYVKPFSLHKVRENCHFLDHQPTPISLRNIKMAPKRVFEWIALSSWRQNYTLQLNICHEACKLQPIWSIMSKISKHWPIFSIQDFCCRYLKSINQFSKFHNVISSKVSDGIRVFLFHSILSKNKIFFLS